MLHHFFQYAWIAEVLFEQFLLCNGLNIADNEDFTFQTIIDIAGECSAISDVVCMGSSVIIVYNKNVNKQVHRKIWNFQLE